MIITREVTVSTSYHAKYEHPQADIVLQSHPGPRLPRGALKTKRVTAYLLEETSSSPQQADDLYTTLYRFRREDLRKKSPILADTLDASSTNANNPTIDGLPVLQLHHSDRLYNFVFGFLSEDVDAFPQLSTTKVKTLCELWDLSIYLETPFIQYQCEQAISQVLEDPDNDQ